MMRKALSIFILVCFLLTSVGGPDFAFAQVPSFAGEAIRLPAPGVMVHLSREFTPAHLQGITIDPHNAFQFDFLVYKGDQALNNGQKKTEYQKLVKYFLASLTIPDKDQWVNLSPYEHDRIIKDDFGKTEMGRDLLSEDYMLKQITSSLIYPEDGLGKSFWDKIYERAWDEYHTTSIPVNTFNKVWIVPDQAIVYESGNTAYILKSHLKVMLEEDYLSLSKHQNASSNTHSIASQVIREIILPEIEREVNEGENFANLRQMFSAMVLATWYKKVLKESLLAKIYVDKAKVKGVDQDPRANERIYGLYLKAFKKGVFNYIKEDLNKYTHEAIPRKYFSGGWISIDKAIIAVSKKDFAQHADEEIIVGPGTLNLVPDLAISDLKGDNAMDVVPIKIAPFGAPAPASMSRRSILAMAGAGAAALTGPFSSGLEGQEIIMGGDIFVDYMKAIQKKLTFKGKTPAWISDELKRHAIEPGWWPADPVLEIVKTIQDCQEEMTHDIYDEAWKIFKQKAKENILRLMKESGALPDEKQAQKKSYEKFLVEDVAEFLAQYNIATSSNLGLVPGQGNGLAAMLMVYFYEINEVKEASISMDNPWGFTVNTHDIDLGKEIVLNDDKDRPKNVAAIQAIYGNILYFPENIIQSVNNFQDIRGGVEATIDQSEDDYMAAYGTDKLACLFYATAKMIWEYHLTPKEKMIELWKIIHKNHEADHLANSERMSSFTTSKMLVSSEIDGYLAGMRDSDIAWGEILSKAYAYHRDAFTQNDPGFKACDYIVNKAVEYIHSKPGEFLMIKEGSSPNEIMAQLYKIKDLVTLGHLADVLYEQHQTEYGRESVQQANFEQQTKEDTGLKARQEISGGIVVGGALGLSLNFLLNRKIAVAKKENGRSKTMRTIKRKGPSKGDHHGRPGGTQTPRSAAMLGQEHDLKNGGIDFNSANFAMVIKRDGKGMPLPYLQQDMAQLSSILGFEAEILEIKPALNIPIIRELQQKLQSNPI